MWVKMVISDYFTIEQVAAEIKYQVENVLYTILICAPFPVVTNMFYA